jgi:hypothetical protein
LESEVAGLTDRLETRKTVERAKGILMTNYGMIEPQAFKWIQRMAMDHRITMREVAERILAEDASGSRTAGTGGAAGAGGEAGSGTGGAGGEAGSGTGGAGGEAAAGTTTDPH